MKEMDKDGECFAGTKLASSIAFNQGVEGQISILQRLYQSLQGRGARYDCARRPFALS